MKKTIKVKTDKLFTILTPQVSEFAKKWGKSGIVNIFKKHTTTSLRVLENELLHHADIRFWLDKYLPKHGIKIKSTRELENINNFFIVVLAWNFSEDIIKKLKKYNKDITVLIPLPEFKIIKL